MTITFVKKVLPSGEPCPKCLDVEKRLGAAGYLERIDRTVVADERDPSSEGMRLAALHDVQIAPFFIVENGLKTTTYTVYLKLVREIFDGAQGVSRDDKIDEAADILRANPDLDLL